MDEQSRESRQACDKNRQSTWRRLVELQLIRVRKEARAARLEAEAAKLELVLRRRETKDGQPYLSVPTETSARPPVRIAKERTGVEDGRSSIASVPVAKPRSQAPKKITATPAQKCARDAPSGKSTSTKRPVAVRSLTGDEPSRAAGSSRASKPSRTSKKRSPFVWSLLAHAIGIALLALVTLQTRHAMDQVTLTASPAAPSTEPIESIKMESTEPSVVSKQDVETSAEVNLKLESPAADIAALSAEALSQGSVGLKQGLNTSSNLSQVLSDDQSQGAATVFCGVEGGGKHFVYLVDSSKSMGSAFHSARSELLRSIDALSGDQRFYVIFFDESPAYMQLGDPGVDDTNSVLASSENKHRIRRWAMGIRMDAGKAPYDPLKFALKLAPDVIFLLSDGEFPAGIEQLLVQSNRIDNLFGENRVRSIVHTIGYHSTQGESRMRRIAIQNEGQFRHVRRPER